MSLYPPPQDVQAEVWTRLPDEHRHAGAFPDWARANRPGHPADSFLEGPSFDRDGNLYVTDIPFGRVFRIAPDASWTLVAEYDGWPNGLKIHRDGRMYFTDQGQSGMHDPSGRVYRYDLASERLDRLIDNAPSPNGLVMTPEEDALLVAMTRGNAVWRVPIFPDGGTSKVSVFTPMAGGVSGADGMAMDVDGTLHVCDAGNGCVWSFSRFAEPRHRYLSPNGRGSTTNCAFGGPGGRDLFVTESSTGSILRVTTPAPGVTMYGLA